MAAVTSDIPFIARRSTRDAAETRERLGIAGDRPFVLACFSGADLGLPYQHIADAEHLTVLAPEREAPAGLTYPDLVAAADVVVSKPGYGIVSECIANGTPLLYTSRGRFVEYDVFVAGDAARAALPLSRPIGFARGPMGRGGPRAARAAAAA